MEQHVRKQMRKHFADLSNKQLLSQIRTLETVQVIEEALGDEILPEIECMEKEGYDVLALGERLSHKDIGTYFPGIKKSVDTLLDIEGPSPDVWIQTFSDRRYLRYLAEMAILGGGMISYLGTSLYTLDLTPSLEVLALGESIGIGLSALAVLFGSPSFYDPIRKDISLQPTRIAYARGVMAHEYTHRVQDMVGIPQGRNFDYIAEGMAEAVRDEVGRHSEASDDLVRYENLQDHFYHMQGAYRLLARQLGVKIKKELIEQEQPWVQSSEKKYAYGTAFFHMQRIEHGPRFCREILDRARQQLSTVTRN